MSAQSSPTPGRPVSPTSSGSSLRPPLNRQAPIYQPPAKPQAAAPKPPAPQWPPLKVVGKSDLRSAVKGALQDIISRQNEADPDHIFLTDAAACGDTVTVHFRDGRSVRGVVITRGPFCILLRKEPGERPALIYKASVEQICFDPGGAEPPAETGSLS